MQTTLETFVYGSENYPRFFIYDWSKRKAYFDFVKPVGKNCQFVKKVRDSVFGFINIILIGKQLNVEHRSYQPIYFDWNNLVKSEIGLKEGDKVIKNYAVLKSSLQKMIRRQNPVLALQSAFTLLHLKPDVFLRRLLIIMIEDVHLHDFFSEICWYMMAFPNYQLDEADLDFLMNSVYTLAKSNIYRSFRSNVRKIEWQLSEMVEKIKKIYKKQIMDEMELKRKMSLILSLYFREQYGGLEGDLKMLGNIRNILFAEWFIFNKKDEVDEKEIIRISSLNEMDEEIKDLAYQFLLLKKIDISSVDFHCCPDMVNFICQKLGGRDKMPDFIVKQIMWRQSSGLNFRRNYKKQVETDRQKEEKIIWEDKIKPIWISWLKMNGYKVLGSIPTP